MVPVLFFAALGCALAATPDPTPIPSQEDTEQKSPAAVIRGAYFHPIENIIVYQTTFPIAFQIELPGKEHNNVPIPVSCDKGHHEFVCQLFNNAADYLYNSKQNWNSVPYKTRPKIAHRWRRGLFDFVGKYIYKPLFGLATESSVQSLHSDEAYLIARQKQLEENLIPAHAKIISAVKNISTYVNITSQLFSGKLEELRKEITLYANAENELNKSVAALGVALTSILEGSVMVERKLIMEGVGDSCRNNLIPRSMIPDKEVLNKMKKIRPMVEEAGYQLIEPLETIFSLEVAECVFAEKDLHVTIKIPLQWRGLNAKVVQVTQIPYQSAGLQCMIHEFPDYAAVFPNAVVPLGKKLYHCQPRQDPLCHIPYSAVLDGGDPCIYAVMNGGAPDIKKSTAVRVTEISEGLYAITAAKNISVRCSDRRMTYASNQDVGATLLRLHCGCSASIDSKITIPRPFPCLQGNESDSVAVTILPPHFSQLDYIRLDGLALFDNITELIDPNWRDEIPTLTVNLPEPAKLDPLPQLLEWQKESSSSTLTTYVWLVIVTILITLLSIAALRLYCSGYHLAGFM